MESFEPSSLPNEELPGRIPTEITLIVLLGLLITANITVIFKCKVHKNLNSLIILCAMTIIQLIRIVTYIWRLINNKWSM